MRGKTPKSSRFQKPRSAESDDAWLELGISEPLLKLARIYKDLVREIHKMEARKLPREREIEAKLQLMSKLSARLVAEVGPIMPEQIDELAGLDALYGVSTESVGLAREGKIHPGVAFGIGVEEFSANHRFHRPFHTIIEEHWAGIPKSTSRYMRLEQDRQDVRYTLKMCPPKGNIDHRVIMQTGLGLGLEKLSAVQLESYYSEFCPCGKDHDADDLRKLRSRILEEGRAARAGITPTKTNPV
jgi:hypothetical protein